MIIHRETATRHAQPEQRTRQHIEIPSSWFGRRSGSYSLITRAVTVKGSVMVQSFRELPTLSPAEWGIARWNGHLVMVASTGGGRWEAFDQNVIHAA